MNSSSAQLGVLAAGGVLIGYPTVQSLRRGQGLPSAHRLVTPMIVIGGAALLAQVSPELGVGLAVLVTLGMLLGTPSAGAKPPPRGGAADTPGGHVQRRRQRGFAGGSGGAW